MTVKTFTAFDPATGKPLEPEYRDATPAEIDETVSSAHDAFETFRSTSGTERAEFLERIADQIMALGDSLIERCSLETGLPPVRLNGERGRTVNQLRLFADILREGSWVDARIDPALPERKPLPRPDLRRMLIPMGPVGVFGASNFPLAFSVAGGDTASALAAGCPVIVKAHPAHPGTSELVAAAITTAAEETAMPAGVFGMVQGAGTEVGKALVEHPLLRAVGFTGSFWGGKALFDAANRRPEPIPVFAEMGSINPVFILPGALENAAKLANGLAGSVTLGVGQFCTNPGLVVLSDSDESDDFVDTLAGELEQIAAGTMLTEKIASAYRSGVERFAKIEGVLLVASGQTGDGSAVGSSSLLKTSGDVFLRNPKLSEEVFGPSTMVVTADGPDQFLEVARSIGGHLTATIHGTDEDLRSHAKLIDVLTQKVGRLIINGFPTGVEVGHAMNHGGPFPATTSVHHTSVGTAAIRRFARPICYQNLPGHLLPDELKDDNPLGIWRLVDGEFKRD